MKSVLRLLHVEDSPDDAELIHAELESAGYVLHHKRVENAADMELALATESWDVILSDFTLPSFDGHGALRILKASGQDIPFILVSGCVGEETAVAMMKAGMHDYVMKGNLARLAPAIERELVEATVRRERKRAEEARNASEKQLRDITSALGEGLLVQGRDGRLLFMNPEAERLLGWKEEELAERDIHETIHYLRPNGTKLPKKECPTLNLTVSESLRHSEDSIFIKKGGVPFPAHYVSTVIAKDGQVDAIVTAFMDISERKRAERELEESRQQLRDLSVFLQTVREEERKRISRELHDELGQALTALRIDVNWLEMRLPYAEPAIADKLISMEHLMNKTVDALRRISEDLRPGMLDDLGLAAALEHHVDQFVVRTGTLCELDLNQEDFEVGDQVATAVFRIIQESLTNVARHSGATRVSVRVEELGNEIRLTVQDDGRGLPPMGSEKRKTYGLLGMRERVKMLGGRFEISSVPARGTRVEAIIPYHGGGGGQ
ncbi:MAG: PAS domain S-box protein [Sulfurimicrobium sp.]|nr:PAS domain S-box protein [Sulfurimicrobium sp.]MDO9191161.1 PAS domain S-box protein [Sulfurimicrobium sp.]MDP1704697.1 PAS domain S-box protein [Sulfurimicrobium sp.]MDP2200083.1 PAS domain S-box protein [Sulfurimicrobium sp.]MDP3686587.1 PAS domain S-box protein [Sulfurimicrobium sp.]